MHGLLEQQLRQYFGDKFSLPPEWRGLLDAVSAAYQEADADRARLEQNAQELRRAQAEMRAVFEAISDVLFRLDSAGTILEYRAGAASDLAPPEGLVGKRIQDIPHQRVGGQFREALDQMRATRSSVQIEYSMALQGRECFYTALLLPLLQDQIIVIVRDISERKQAEAEHARLLLDLQRRSTRLQTAAEVAKFASTILDLESLMSQTVNLIQERFDFYYVGLFLVDAAGQYAALRAGTGQAGQQMLQAGHKLAVGGGSMIGWCVANAQARIALDVGAEAIRFDNPYLPLTRSEMALPLISRAHVLGALTVQSALEAAFTNEDIIVLQAMADQLAVAIENARLFEAAQRRADEAETLRQAGAVVAATLKQAEAIELILQQLARVVPYDSASVQLLRQGYLEIVGGRGWPDPAVVLGARFPIPGDNPNTLVIQQRRPCILGDAPAAYASFRQPPHNYIQSFLGAPLVVHERVIGMLAVDSRQPNYFSAEHARLVSAFADQVAIALENARLFEQTQHHLEELAGALARLKELDRLKNEFIQNVSHELRTPLAIARGHAELLESGEMGELAPEQQESVNVIARRMRMLSKMMDDLYVLLEVETREVKREPIDLAQMLESVLADFQIAARNAKLTLSAQVAPGPVRVLGETAHLHRVVDNLLTNAFKFTPPGGRVDVRLRRDGASAVLQVADTGIGIPSDKLACVFDRFYQVDGSSTRRYGGVGLGLALVKEIVQGYGGRVSVESALGQGSTFSVILPVCPE